jgi:hypothetical protein
MSNVLGRQALVIGAGMGGLAAAGALANHFEQVTVSERDGLAHEPSHRAGTPQGRQLHGLLSGGLEALCRIFPGLDRDLAAAGAVPIRVAADLREELPGLTPFPAAISAGSSTPRLGRCSSTPSGDARWRIATSRSVAIVAFSSWSHRRTAATSPVSDARGPMARGRRLRPTSSSTHPRAARSRSQRSTPWGAHGRARRPSGSISATLRQPSRSRAAPRLEGRAHIPQRSERCSERLSVGGRRKPLDGLRCGTALRQAAPRPR